MCVVAPGLGMIVCGRLMSMCCRVCRVPGHHPDWCRRAGQPRCVIGVQFAFPVQWQCPVFCLHVWCSHEYLSLLPLPPPTPSCATAPRTEEVLHEIRVAASEFSVFPETGQWGLRIHSIELMKRHCSLHRALTGPNRPLGVTSPTMWPDDVVRPSDHVLPPSLASAASHGGSIGVGLAHIGMHTGVGAAATATAAAVGPGGVAGAGAATMGDVPAWSKDVLAQPVAFRDVEKYMHVGAFCIEECPVPIVRYPFAPGVPSPSYDTTVVDMFASGMPWHAQRRSLYGGVVGLWASWDLERSRLDRAELR